MDPEIVASTPEMGILKRMTECRHPVRQLVQQSRSVLLQPCLKSPAASSRTPRRGTGPPSRATRTRRSLEFGSDGTVS